MGRRWILGDAGPPSLPSLENVLRVIGAICLILVALGGRAAMADDELQKKLANPVADIVTLPLQYTGTFNTGPLEGLQHMLNIQPVYPMPLGSDVSMINRLIVPIVSQPAFASDQDRITGLGDISYEIFFSPARPGKIIWGAGPTVSMNTATDGVLGSGKWSAGPAVVMMVQPGRWSVGALVTQVWSFAGGDERPDVSQAQFQPILSYRLSPIHSIGYAGIIVANWKQHGGERWTVPLGLTWSWLIKPKGFVPVNFIVGGGYNVVRPDDAGDWFMRFQVNFILPKGKPHASR